MDTGQMCTESASTESGTDFRTEQTADDLDSRRLRMTPADVIYRVATVTAVLYLLVSIL